MERDARRARVITMDVEDGSPGPKPGDHLISQGKRRLGSRYLVKKSRPVKRRDPEAVPRFKLIVVKVPEMTPCSGLRWRFTWWPRKKKVLSFEQYMKRDIGE